MDMGASVIARLKNKAKETGKPFQLHLQLFCQEEFLRRLAASKYAENADAWWASACHRLDGDNTLDFLFAEIAIEFRQRHHKKHRISIEIWCFSNFLRHLLGPVLPPGFILGFTEKRRFLIIGNIKLFKKFVFDFPGANTRFAVYPFIWTHSHSYLHSSKP